MDPYTTSPTARNPTSYTGIYTECSLFIPSIVTNTYLHEWSHDSPGRQCGLGAWLSCYPSLQLLYYTSPQQHHPPALSALPVLCPTTLHYLQCTYNNNTPLKGGKLKRCTGDHKQIKLFYEMKSPAG